MVGGVHVPSAGRVLFNSSELYAPAAEEASGVEPQEEDDAGEGRGRGQEQEQERAGERVGEWEVYREQAGGVGSARSQASAPQHGPLEQLSLTNGFSTDYLW